MLPCVTTPTLDFGYELLRTSTPPPSRPELAVQTSPKTVLRNEVTNLLCPLTVAELKDEFSPKMLIARIEEIFGTDHSLFRLIFSDIAI